MTSMQQDTNQINLQAKLFDFSIAELVCQHRNSFEPLWTVDSWVKFLIWMSLNCGMAGEKESLKVFADSLGAPLTSRMRKLFFERTLQKYSMKLMADPAESQVLLMPLNSMANNNSSSFSNSAEDALNQVGLSERVVLDRNLWQSFDSLMVIPWK
tara:strand:- start:584 stop:1048 length:465 start_codon:yes stop_codon:yes gene_type:complete